MTSCSLSSDPQSSLSILSNFDIRKALPFRTFAVSALVAKMTVNVPTRRFPNLLHSRFPSDILRSLARRHPTVARNSSHDASLTDKRPALFPDRSGRNATEPPALARLPTASVFRSLFLGAFFSSPVLFAPGFALLQKIAKSPSRALNPDRNPLLRAVVKPLVYDQFCAGTNRAEIRATVARIKDLGFSGVILCYGKEVQVQKSSRPHVDDLDGAHQRLDQELELWKQGNLETLDMIGDGDYLGIKYYAPISLEKKEKE